MMITCANKKDIEGILEVQESLLLRNLDNKPSSGQGFLVYPVNSKQLLEVLKNPRDMVLCAKQDNDVVGYILAYDLNNWMIFKTDWIEKIKVSPKIKTSIKNDKVVYLRHIARKRGFKNTGANLLKTFYKTYSYKLIAPFLNFLILNVVINNIICYKLILIHFQYNFTKKN